MMKTISCIWAFFTGLYLGILIGLVTGIPLGITTAISAILCATIGLFEKRVKGPVWLILSLLSYGFICSYFVTIPGRIGWDTSTQHLIGFLIILAIGWMVKNCHSLKADDRSWWWKHHLNPNRDR